MKTVIHQENERGKADHGWLKAAHSFSFASWYDPARMHFGMLRVLNDDLIAPGKGFGMHPHNDMEIITIILSGELEHKDSMGNGSVIRTGDVQVMSAGSGVLHSEFNPSDKNPTRLFQLWIFPKEKNIEPRYGQKNFNIRSLENNIQTVASGFNIGDELYIHQDAAVSICKLNAESGIQYDLFRKENGVYIMNIDGKTVVEGNKLGNRDAVGITEKDYIEIKAIEDTELLIVEVPMK
ncbi:MAG: pirin family protein [Bacteroidetes bacterium]|nr:MAG: pirin family protein [Bacteroidota bacterium]REK00802.1 MAG: pirin family protein [Bacteroidota bacterium]REK35299.1 MAG: pirin family protein [Bacteroidota bacterium]